MNMPEQGISRRQIEDRLYKKLKDANEQNSSEISKMMDDAIRHKHKVYVATDFHLFKRKEKNKAECHKRSNFNKIIKNLEIIEPDDVFIYLGDLVDGEFTKKEELKEIIKEFPGKKILVKGNNDLFENSFYRSCGFEYVVDSFVWHNVLFSHIPQKNDNDVNIHGHIHGYKTYWIPYTNQIDVAAYEGREKPLELTSIINKQKAYSKIIKESPEHFGEGYQMHIGSSIFIEDPFDDEWDDWITCCGD